MTAILLIAGGCKSSTAIKASYEPAVQPIVLGYGNATTTDVNFLPKAHIYKTTGNYKDNVPVTLNASGNQLVSFPAPGDLTEAAPVQLNDGYLLDCRGINSNTAFTSYTYAQYAALPQAPAPSALIQAIIPGANVTEIVELPMTLAEAMADTTRVNALIKAGLPGYTVIYDTPRVPVDD